MEVKKQHLQPVLPEDFKDMEGLLRAAHEGRLFMVPPTHPLRAPSSGLPRSWPMWIASHPMR